MKELSRQILLLDVQNDEYTKPDEDTVEVFTDGSASVKDKTGGWAFVVKHRDKIATRCGAKSGTTISEMEITAIYRALSFLKAAPFPVVIYSDSQYAINSVTKWCIGWAQQGWRTSTGNPVAHVELIQDTINTLTMHYKIRDLRLAWVRGHAGTKGNEHADSLAGMVRRNPSKATWKKTDWKFHADFLSQGHEAVLTPRQINRLTKLKP